MVRRFGKATVPSPEEQLQAVQAQHSQSLSLFDVVASELEGTASAASALADQAAREQERYRVLMADATQEASLAQKRAEKIREFTG